MGIYTAFSGIQSLMTRGHSSIRHLWRLAETPEGFTNRGGSDKLVKNNKRKVR